MLPKKNKLQKSLFECNPNPIRKLFYDGFAVYYKKSDEECSRFAIIVPKKIYKKATQRNRIKRYFYNLISLSLQDLKVSVQAKIRIVKIINEKYKEQIKENLNIFIKKANENN